MTTLDNAVRAYFQRCAVANADKRGADHALILDETAKAYSVDYSELSEATLNKQFTGRG